MQLIENTSDLEQLCRNLSQKNFVCVDLEFLRERTYFAKLCLIQIASDDSAAIIDPLAPDIDLASFLALMQNPAVTKVFHSGRQDIEIIYNLGGKIPAPLFDTQIAAQAEGFGEAVSYEHLAGALLRIRLNKTSRLSDWSKRPLTGKQLEYALSDVTHLVHIYRHQIDWLTQSNRLGWIKDELDDLSDENLYKIDPYNVWKKIRCRISDPFFLTLLRELAAWREQRAITKNVPRQSFIKDDVLINICACCPKTKEDLAGIRNMRADLAAGKIGDEIIAVLGKAGQTDPKDYICLPAERRFNDSAQSLHELLKLLLKMTAAEEKVIPRMIASDSDLALFSHTGEDVPFLHGWRYEIFGRAAEKIKSGKTGLAYNPRRRRFDLISLSE